MSCGKEPKPSAPTKSKKTGGFFAPRACLCRKCIVSLFCNYFTTKFFFMKAILYFMSALLAVLLCGRLYADPPGKPPGIITQPTIVQPAIVLPPPTAQPQGKSEPPGIVTQPAIVQPAIVLPPPTTQPPGKSEPPGSVWDKELPPASYKVIRKVSIGSNRRE